MLPSGPNKYGDHSPSPDIEPNGFRTAGDQGGSAVAAGVAVNVCEACGWEVAELVALGIAVAGSAAGEAVFTGRTAIGVSWETVFDVGVTATAQGEAGSPLEPDCRRWSMSCAWNTQLSTRAVASSPMRLRSSSAPCAPIDGKMLTDAYSPTASKINTARQPSSIFVILLFFMVIVF